MSVSSELAGLFRRDLDRLGKQIEAFRDDKELWRTLPGITNSAGNLALHLEGNLREYVGRQLGQVPYVRQRELEFSSAGISKEELLDRIAGLSRSIPAIVEALSPAQLAVEFPQVVIGRATSTNEFLIHLYGHLTWHLGQIDYLRRILSGE